MSNWFKKLFGGSCCCHKGEECCKNKEEETVTQEDMAEMPSSMPEQIVETPVSSDEPEARTE